MKLLLYKSYFCKPLLQISETEFQPRRTYEKLVQSQQEKQFRRFDNKLNNCKLLTLSTRLQLNC